MLRYALLGILNYRAMNGYQLKQFMDTSTSHFWYVKFTQMYSTLKTLEQEGLLTSEVQPQDHRPDRRMYSITDAGRRELLVWLAQPLTELEPSKEPFLLKLFFSAQLDKDSILAQLHIYRALFQRLAETFRKEAAERIRLSAEQNPTLEKDTLLWEATRRLGELSADLYVRWLEETIAMVQSKF